MLKDFFISDLHFGDANIIWYEDRPFKSVEEMDETLIVNCNSVVGKNDNLIVAGDVSFYEDTAKTRDLVQRLHGHKTLVCGNHDFRGVNFWMEMGFDVVYLHPFLFADFYVVSHEPIYLNKHMPYANIHGHTHGLCYDSNQYFNVSAEHIGYTPIIASAIKEATMRKTAI